MHMSQGNMDNLDAKKATVSAVLDVRRSEPDALAARDGLMDTRSAAVALGVSPLSLVDWRCKGIGPGFIRVGRCIRYRKSDLESWLDTRTVHPCSTSQRA